MRNRCIDLYLVTHLFKGNRLRFDISCFFNMSYVFLNVSFQVLVIGVYRFIIVDSFIQTKFIVNYFLISLMCFLCVGYFVLNLI